MSGSSVLAANLPQQLPLESRSVTIVIPALNEEGNLERLLHLIEKAFLSLGFTLPVILIDDGSTDESPRILVQLQQKYDFLTVITHPQRLGVTHVWKTAIANTTSDWIFWGQADLESNPELDIPILLGACTKEVHAVAGWRQNRGDGKKLASNVANTTCRLLFGLKIHDMNWIKLVPRELVAVLPMDVITHRYLLAVLAGFGYHIAEVPTPWFPRYSGYSKFGKRRLLSSSVDFLRAFRWFISKRFSKASSDFVDSEKENAADTSNFPSQS
ncbi:family 2 glycosyl transferase [Pseudanabaena sp. SR411]|uniref:glycosyltransferase family 2 protein n=1 Tax=Pseudanabaena sp. SR411 TaxID=1980935 RepID=UPI000B99CA41|nr:glycosyltransferase family 2 protein [Pseudanabaena sp. SR411]OYQ64818.1 family 2 glycosyl transferase [Pseudanabaena sp. SR411]